MDDYDKRNLVLFPTMAGVGSFFYMYSDLNKKTPSFTIQKRLLLCSASGLLAFLATRLVIKNINNA